MKQARRRNFKTYKEVYCHIDFFFAGEEGIVEFTSVDNLGGFQCPRGEDGFFVGGGEIAIDASEFQLRLGDSLLDGSGAIEWVCTTGEKGFEVNVLEISRLGDT